LLYIIKIEYFFFYLFIVWTKKTKAISKKQKAKSNKQMMMCQACEFNICAINICDLPNEIIALIVDRLGNKDYLISFKETCVLFSKSVSQFYIAGQMVATHYGVFTERYFDNRFEFHHVMGDCANANCYYDTEAVCEYVWNYGYRHYYHRIQKPMQSTTMFVNGKEYPVKHHYCPECFVKFVLVGSNPNASRHYGDHTSDGNKQVNVSFNAEPTPSTWIHYQTWDKKPLTKWQVNALNGKFD
jgi:hypothetical protein